MQGAACAYVSGYEVRHRYYTFLSLFLHFFFLKKNQYFLYFQQAGSLTVIFIHGLDILLTYVSSFSTLFTCL